MITMFQQRLKTHIPTTPAPATATATSGPLAGPVTATSTAVGEILTLRVGCWQAPVHVGIELPLVEEVTARTAATTRSTEDRVGEKKAAKSGAAPS